MTAPLEGLRILELAHILARSWIGQILTDLGTEVVKPESSAGDNTHGWGSPFVTGEYGKVATRRKEG